ncbi:MAG: DEAD/DEAH box helicase family protein [Candidatus Didemnitutus sp.]|nr:DEAD/DEAH box helicase family protein [Candidatus Didemnitutus sp.]
MFARSLRDRLQDLPALDPTGLRACQIDAITNLDASLKAAKPRILVQMATGSGKTFTAITSIYRLLKHARVRRVLFLVDTRNLGEQAEQEFLAYTPSDDNRKFTELYTVTRLASSHLPTDAEVFIACCNPDNRHKRKETWHAEKNPTGRWRKFTHAELAARDKTSLDLFWLKDDSLADLDNLPEPADLAEEIIENIEAGLANFRTVAASLGKSVP